MEKKLKKAIEKTISEQFRIVKKENSGIGFYTELDNLRYIIETCFAKDSEKIKEVC